MLLPAEPPRDRIMTRSELLNRLEGSLTRLVDGMLIEKSQSIDFLTGLDRLDDIAADLRRGINADDRLTRFFADNKGWLEDPSLSATQKNRAGTLLKEAGEALSARPDPEAVKLNQEAEDWSRALGVRPLRLTLKAPQEQASLSDRFHALLRREAEELNMLLSEREHLMTCLDDILSSAELKQDRMHHHLAASLIYFLKQEGYKVEPYVRRLRRIQDMMENKKPC
jgi:hypothetical protein